MDRPVDMEINDYGLSQQMQSFLTLGHYFAFLGAGAPRKKTKRSRRMARLLVQEEETNARVFPLVGDRIELPGVTLVPRDRSLEPLGCLVTDRDLYRAEEDTVYLFACVPSPPEDLEMVVECNGASFTERQLKLVDGVGMETLSMLLPGSYSAQLAISGERIGAPVSFTVAEYTLAPLSGRLRSHELDRDKEELTFELEVESYQIPCEGRLEVSLVEAGRPISSATLTPESAGRYRGQLEIRGEGPFFLQLIDTEDAERVAEVAIPGSRAAERDLTVISELGQELLFSMMPETGALPLRGGYLSEGDVMATPLTVEEVVAKQWVIRARQDVESLHLVTIDLLTGGMTATKHGDVKAGEEVIVNAESSMCSVIAGCFVGGRPFEGFTTFVKPTAFEVEVDTPESIRSGEDLVIRLSVKGLEKEVPVLLSVRDERLTSLDRPSLGLGGSTKRAVARATEGMEEGFLDLEEHLFSFSPLAGSAPVSRSRQAMDRIDPIRMDSIPMGAVMEELEAAGAGAAESTDFEISAPAEEPARAEFPQVLFYGMVPVSGAKEVVIPVGDALATYAVEAFTLADGDWVEACKSVIVDKPVRIDLEFPPAVALEDDVTGRLRAVTSSGKARISLTRDGEAVSFPGSDEPVIDTPKQIEIPVKPGTYLARVEDVSTGEVDSVEVLVGTPGRFKSYAKELALLQAGEVLTLDSADALTLRVLLAVDEPLNGLLTATAGYAHLCCEQTAAKILAATWVVLTEQSQSDRRRAEEIILAGIARERKMLRPGKGFTMYPGEKQVVGHYSRLAVRYLWSLEKLDEIPDLSRALRDATREGVEMADTAAKAHRMARVPKTIDSIEDAYAAAVAGDGSSSVVEFLSSRIDSTGAEIRVRGGGRHAVAERAELAYAAASFLALGQLALGVRIANQVTRQLNEEGRLYSTVDSVAAIALMIQLRASQLATGGRMRVNGKEMSVPEAAELSDQVESVEVLEGAAAVEVTRIREEDWSAFSSGFPLRVGFRDTRNKRMKRFRMGDRAELVVTMPDGYQAGDLVHVSLPACMSWLRGGGKVKQFTMDFEGSGEMRVPVVVTSKITGKQHFALCVRNMFEEERATSPGLLTVKAAS